MNRSNYSHVNRVNLSEIMSAAALQSALQTVHHDVRLIRQLKTFPKIQTKVTSPLDKRRHLYTVNWEMTHAVWLGTHLSGSYFNIKTLRALGNCGGLITGWNSNFSASRLYIQKYLPSFRRSSPATNIVFGSCWVDFGEVFPLFWTFYVNLLVSADCLYIDFVFNTMHNILSCCVWLLLSSTNSAINLTFSYNN